MDTVDEHQGDAGAQDGDPFAGVDELPADGYSGDVGGAGVDDVPEYSPDAVPAAADQVEHAGDAVPEDLADAIAPDDAGELPAAAAVAEPPRTAPRQARFPVTMTTTAAAPTRRSRTTRGAPRARRRPFPAQDRGGVAIESPAMGPREAPRPTRAKRPTALAERLTAARLGRGLTQAQAAAEIGVSLRTLHGWESGDTEPRGKLQVDAVAAFIAASSPETKRRRR